MKRFSSMLLFASFFSCCSIPAVLCAQCAAPEHVIVDGNLAEWGDSLRYYDKAANLFYDVFNDAGFLYIAFRRPKYGWKIVLPKRMVFTISVDDNAGPEIIYPAHYSDNKDEMWNFLEVKKTGGRVFDTVTIYNDYGIQAAGGFWSKQVAAGKSAVINADNDLAPVHAGFGFVQAPADRPRAATRVVTVVGADGELAIPMSLLPATTGTCHIQVVIAGEPEMGIALTSVGYLAGFNLAAGTPDDVEELVTSSKLSITYRLK